MRRPRRETASPGEGATMQDIAKHLGISVPTVSRALRRVYGINPETRAKILHAAWELGYRLPKSYQNKSLNGEELTQIGVFIERGHGQTSSYFRGMSEASLALNASLVIHYVKPDECHTVLDPALAPRAMTSGLLAGLILVDWWPLDVVLELSRRLPTVSIMHRYPGTELDVIGIDNESGMNLLMHELYALGHRRIGFVGQCGSVHWANARLGGYLGALTELGMEYNPHWVISADFDTLTDENADWAAQAAEVERLTRDENVTAWMSVCEAGGLKLYEHLSARGLRIPQDLSITGFHRPAQIREDKPSLTSVGASFEGIGAAALKRLLFRVQNPLETYRTILFPCELYHGTSIAAPRD